MPDLPLQHLCAITLYSDPCTGLTLDLTIARVVLPTLLLFTALFCRYSCY